MGRETDRHVAGKQNIATRWDHTRNIFGHIIPIGVITTALVACLEIIDAASRSAEFIGWGRVPRFEDVGRKEADLDARRFYCLRDGAPITRGRRHVAVILNGRLIGFADADGASTVSGRDRCSG